jgi:uncharacterized membrane protein
MDLGRIRQELQSVPGTPRNVGDMERWASMVGGGALTAFGLSRRTPMGVGLALLGGMLFHRGSTGRCSLYNKLGINTRQ